MKCATCGAACTGHPAGSRGKTYHYYTCRAGRPYRGGDGLHKSPYLNAVWLEDLVWPDLRRFLENLGEVLERVREQAELADTTEAWLMALRERVEEVEGDTEEAFQARRRLVKLLVQTISVGKRANDGRAKIRITYRFGPPPSGAVAAQSSVDSFKNGSRS